jgi:hypothetical protein
MESNSFNIDASMSFASSHLIPSQLSAKEYIQKHNLDNVLAELLNTLVYNKVRNPEIFMIKYLSNLMSQEDQIKNGISVPAMTMIESIPLVKYPTNIINPLIKKVLSQKLWSDIRFFKTNYNGNINDIIKGDKISLTDESVSLYLLYSVWKLSKNSSFQ